MPRDFATERTTTVDMLPRPLRVLMAPLFWLERARGRWRLLLLLVYLVVLLVVGTLLWRAMSLRGLPDIGDPFDVAAFLKTAEIPEERNAFALYQEAAARSLPLEPITTPSVGRQLKPVPVLRNSAIDAWIEANEISLALWLAATRRSDGVAVSPSGRTRYTNTTVFERLSELTDLAKFAATRRMMRGEVAEAWTYYLGALRASRHITRFGSFMQRELGCQMLSAATSDASRWVSDSRVGPDLLRQAIADLGEIRSLGAPLVENVKTEYLIFRNSVRSPSILKDMTWLPTVPNEWKLLWLRAPGAIMFFKREPERSERVIQHVFANWIREMQKPPAARMLFGPGVGSIPPLPPGGVRAVSAGGPELSGGELNKWLDSSLLARVHLPALFRMLSMESLEVQLIENLRMSCAMRLYKLENGRDPKRLKELVGRYIDRLPEEYAEIEVAIDAREAYEAEKAAAKGE